MCDYFLLRIDCGFIKNEQIETAPGSLPGFCFACSAAPRGRLFRALTAPERSTGTPVPARGSEPTEGTRASHRATQHDTRNRDTLTEPTESPTEPRNGAKV